MTPTVIAFPPPPYRIVLTQEQVEQSTEKMVKASEINWSFR